MAFLDNNGLETLWGRIKTKFGASFAALVKDSTSVTIKLQNGYGNDLDTVAIPLADSTNSKAGLMSPTEKSKLAGIAAGAEVNVQSDWNATSGDAFIKNKPTIPAAVQPTTTTPKMDGTAAVGTETKYARGDHVHPSDTTKVDKVEGKGLSTNDYTTADKSKLAGIAAGAEVNVQADWNETDSTSDAYIANKPTIPTVPSNIVNKITTTAGAHTAITNATGNVSFKVPTEASHVGAVPTSRTVNGKALSSNITLKATDIHIVSQDVQWETVEQGLLTLTSGKVDKVEGKGLSTNDYTTADKTKVGYVDTGKSVSTYVSEQIASAQTGASKYKGTVGTGGTVTTLPTSGYKQGDYYVVCAEGTYAGETCEVGDMIFCNKDYASGAVAADDWDVVQANITAMTTAEINAICV